MAKKAARLLVPVERIEKAILSLHGQKVMLDRDLAELYGVKAIALRQQVKRNRERFPEDFMFQLTPEEARALVSQKVIPSLRSLGGSLPYAFTQEGVATSMYNNCGCLRASASSAIGIILLVSLILWKGSSVPVPAADPPESPPPLEITKDTTLDPAKTYGRIVIKASNITIDGRGAWVIGATKGDTTTYKQIGIFAEAVSGVTLKNVKVKGWETGLKIVNGSKWLVENCDFSDNYHNPEQGWWGPEFRGGMVLEKVDHSTLRKNKANRVWDACSLIQSDENTVEENDFSHTSNTCLRSGRPAEIRSQKQPQLGPAHQTGRSACARLGLFTGRGRVERQQIPEQRHHPRWRWRVHSRLERLGQQRQSV